MGIKQLIEAKITALNKAQQRRRELRTLREAQRREAQRQRWLDVNTRD